MCVMSVNETALITVSYCTSSGGERGIIATSNTYTLNMFASVLTFLICG